MSAREAPTRRPKSSVRQASAQSSRGSKSSSQVLKSTGSSARFGRFRGLPLPRFACAPTLYEEPRDESPRFAPACVLALSALGDTEWDGSWRMEKSQESRLLRRIASNDSFASAGYKPLFLGGARGVSKEQVQAFVKKEENRKSIRHMPKAVHGLLSEDIVEKAFKNFDVNADGQLDEEEFSDFLECLEGLHLQYLLGQAFVAARCFFARGERWRVAGPMDVLRPEDLHDMAGPLAPSRGSSPRPRGCFQLGREPDGLLPRGWSVDLQYYCANNHPLYSIFTCDPNNPLSSAERLAMELATVGFTTACVAFTAWRKKQGPETFGIGVTIAGMLLWWTLFLLFTCPRLGQLDLSQPGSGGGAARCARRWTSLGAALGYMLLLPWLAFLGWVLYLKANDSERMVAQVDFLVVLLKRAKSYVISFVIAVVLSFNPLVAWGQPDPTAGSCLGDYVGIGQWRIERQRFQASCADLLAQGGNAGFLQLHAIKNCGGCAMA